MKGNLKLYEAVFNIKNLNGRPTKTYDTVWAVGPNGAKALINFKYRGQVTRFDAVRRVPQD